MSTRSEIFSSGLPSDEKLNRMRGANGGDGYARSLTRMYHDSPMPEPGLTLVAKEEGKDVYLFRREGTSQGFLAIPDEHVMKGPLDFEELESLDVWEPTEEDADEIIASTIS